jgi:hypothetical protein
MMQRTNMIQPSTAKEKEGERYFIKGKDHSSQSL